jgi:hypothetical protein
MYAKVIDLILKTDKNLVKDMLLASMTKEEISKFIEELKERVKNKNRCGEKYLH